MTHFLLLVLIKNTFSIAQYWFWKLELWRFWWIIFLPYYFASFLKEILLNLSLWQEYTIMYLGTQGIVFLFSKHPQDLNLFKLSEHSKLYYTQGYEEPKDIGTVLTISQQEA